MSKVDFSYAFATPHVLTLSRPSASQKVVASVKDGGLYLDYTYQSLADKPQLAWTKMPFDIRTGCYFKVGKQKLPFKKWQRGASGIPALRASGDFGSGEFGVYGIATKEGVVIKINVRFLQGASDDVYFDFAHLNTWVISNKGWIDGVNDNVLLTMQQGAADRMVAYATGGDSFVMYRDGVSTISGVPMSDRTYDEQEKSTKKLTMLFKAQSGECKSGYVFLPYDKYFDDLEDIKAYDFKKEIAVAEKEWFELLDRAAYIEICDEDIKDCFRACVADLFVMRELTAGKYYGVACGTDVYRSINSSEGVLAELFFDRAGFEKEAAEDAELFLSGQDANGCWAYSKGWEHEGWMVVYNKARLVLNRYYLTGDKAWLEKQYPRLIASTLFNAKSRLANKAVPGEARYGLMPRGMGDCGMMNGSDYYGYFYPHNFLCVAADRITLEVSQILGKTEDFETLREIYEEAKNDILVSVWNNYVTDDNGNRYIPSVAKQPPTSLYGCLYGYYPSGIMAYEDELIQGAIKHIEQGGISEGGLPIGTGWQKDGLWVAMAMNDIASVYLRAGEYDKASAFLYPVFNHATPFVTWCEERGVEKGSTKTGGDLQHSWTPIAAATYMLDAFVFEDDEEIHLAAGIVREWLEIGKTVGIDGVRTSQGTISFRLTNNGDNFSLKLIASGKRTGKAKKCRVHLRSDVVRQNESVVFESVDKACGERIVKI